MATAALRDEAEIVVVGAGPAGCTAAATLAELGHEVLLVDKHDFPREKPCGDGLLAPAVVIAERLGLGPLLDSYPPITATRVFVGHRRQVGSDFPQGPGHPLPRCIPRNEFDAGLLGAARERGARFLRARVDSMHSDEDSHRLSADDGDDRFDLRAGTVIAADGATSRLRRVTSERALRPGSYAIRQYFRTERPLEPVFQADVPMEIDGRMLPGYGWVFPIDEHVANIGVGIICEPHQPTPRLRAVLATYLAELTRRGRRRRLGEIEPLASPLGSPGGTRDRVEVAAVPGLALIGDAAGTTHPTTGEGISFAMRGAEAMARAIHARSRRGNGRRLADSPANEVWRGFPQLGVDTAGVVRVTMMKANQTPSMPNPARSADEPFLLRSSRLLQASAYDTAVSGTPTWVALNGSDPELGEALERTNGLLLERTSNRMPTVTEVLNDLITEYLGPLYAAVALATAAANGPLRAGAYEAAVAVEAAGVLPQLMAMLIDRARTKPVKANNAIVVLSGDFAATRSVIAATKVGAEAVAALASATQAGCVGGMRDAAARYATDREPADWLRAARETEGTGMVLATEFGALARDEGVEAAAPLREFGTELGVAMRLAESIVELTVGQEPYGEPGAGLRFGIYPLPVLYAIEADPSMIRLLALHGAGQVGIAQILDSIRECGALDRAVRECGQRAGVARAVAESWGGATGPALAALASLPAEYVSSRLPGAALGTR